MATRLALSFWVGGAVLFVITSVAEQRYSQFDSVIKDQLATIRFPLYYSFGWACLGITLVCSALGMVLTTGCLRKRLLAAFLLTLLSTGVAVADYRWFISLYRNLLSLPDRCETRNSSRCMNAPESSMKFTS